MIDWVERLGAAGINPAFGWNVTVIVFGSLIGLIGLGAWLLGGGSALATLAAVVLACRHWSSVLRIAAI